MTPPRRSALAPILAAALLAGAAWAAEVAAPQPPVATQPPAIAQAAPAPQPAKPSVSTQAPIRPAAVRRAPPPRPESSPTWGELTVPQRQALAPLAGTWRSLGEAHKRKWLALSQNFATMPPEEQVRLHSRMTEWASLSPQQRNAARLNYVEAQKVSPSDKRAKWEAYQALSPEEKKRLAARAPKPSAPPTAMAVKPQKVTKVPHAKKGENGAKLAVIPGQVDNHTLLPQPAAPVQR